MLFKKYLLSVFYSQDTTLHANEGYNERQVRQLISMGLQSRKGERMKSMEKESWALKGREKLHRRFLSGVSNSEWDFFVKNQGKGHRPREGHN